jgi:predicted ferric reductase
MGGTVQKGPVQLLWLLLLLFYGVILVHKMVRWILLRRRPFKVTEVRKESESAWTLVFEGDHGPYKPGQFMIVQLKRKGAVSEPHPFTLSSSPTQEKLAVTVKAVGDFTSTLSQTKVSDVGYLDMPYGVFSFLNSTGQDFVFIAGGIGITPFISMLRYMRDRALRNPVLLLWANRTEGEILFRQELEKPAGEWPSLRIVHVLSRQDSWHGEKGHIDGEMLRKYVKDFERPHFFICGPPLMMKDVERTLRGFGVPGKRIQMERFALR